MDSRHEFRGPSMDRMDLVSIPAVSVRVGSDRSPFLSLALFKVFLLLFRYTQFRKLVMALLTTDRPAMIVILVSYLVLGAGLIAIGLLI